ncbi:MAG: stalk domain-containing protein, partial [Symbiobacteriaceae bacterium]|nr:stalk domain-containing protein [Symbiobacteriaceae bacterium]
MSFTISKPFSRRIAILLITAWCCNLMSISLNASPLSGSGFPDYITPAVPTEMLPEDMELTTLISAESASLSGRFDLLIGNTSQLLMSAQRPWINEQMLLTYEQRINITNLFDIPAQDLELKIMLLPHSSSGYQVIFEERIWPMVSEIVELPDGSRYAIIRCDSLWPGENLLITVSYNLVNTSWETDKSLLHLYGELPRDPKALLALLPEVRVESDHPEIIALARDIIGLETNPFHKAELIYTWVNQNLVYDEDARYAHQGAYAALRNRRGVCTEFAALYVALLRACGVPARLIGGYLLRSAAAARVDQSLDTGLLQAHTWAEFYLEGFGWIPCEPTYELIESEVRFTSLRYFAALPHWGHVITNTSLGGGVIDGRQFDLYYSGFKDMLRGTVTSSFQPGQRLMGDEVKVYLYDWDSRVLFSDVQPQIHPGGVTVLPMRRIFEILGAEVVWDDEDRSILAVLGTNQVLLKIDVPIININGIDHELLVAPYIDPSTERTLVPLRAVSEGLGASVFWDQVWRSVL